MNNPIPINDNKMVILFRLEPGCLGPDGADHINTFCSIAQRAIVTLNADVCHWLLEPRFDKSLEEIQYSLAGKTLSKEKAAKYLQSFGLNIDELEEHFEDKMTKLINQYIARKE